MRSNFNRHFDLFVTVAIASVQEVLNDAGQFSPEGLDGFCLRHKTGNVITLRN